MSKLTFKKGKKEIVLNQPAVLLGNGINYVKDFELSWTELLESVFQENDPDIFKIPARGKKKFNLDGLTYPEIAELAELKYKELSEKDRNKNSVKKQICKKIHDHDLNIRNYNKRSQQEQLVKNCETLNIPILTTNYDHNLLFDYIETVKQPYLSSKVEEINWIFRTNREEKSISNNDKAKLFNAYFRKNKFPTKRPFDIRKKFAIWPIHGTKRYASSICINNIDYARKISDIHKRMSSKKDIYLQNEDWEGKYSWINIFLNNDLIILGLGLTRDETDLRWLLVERYIYQNWIKRHYPRKKQSRTIYLYAERKDKKTKKVKPLDSGTKCFFDSLGIDCVKIPDSQMYKFEYLKEFKKY
ncbi:MAG: hypothetical protein MJ184_05480 [Treponema sp.]|uniref:hypothetical protein n=1 Tax=Treponema sp. TaxID=166 RepID=UPI00298E5C68|nr:hypothetical protein [Treponema sp.]MCQ2600794.1 hypothetical protein [Treponema sp.]